MQARAVCPTLMSHTPPALQSPNDKNEGLIMRGNLTIEATVLEVEHRKGDFTNNDGEKVEYDFHVAHVLVGRDVVQVRYNKDNGDTTLPAEGDVIRVEVALPPKTKVVARRTLAKSAPAAVRAAG